MPIARLIKSLSLNRQPVPWRRMLQLSVSTALVLAVGLGFRQPAGTVLAVFVSYYVFSLDFGGPFNHRYPTMAAGLLGIVACAALGYTLHELVWAKLAAIFLFTALSGWAYTSGPRLAQVFRFSTVALLVGAMLPVISAQVLPFVALGAVVGLVVAAVEEWLLGWRRRRFPGTLAAETQNVVAYHRVNLRFTLCYSVVAVTGLLLAEWLGMERPYWVTITTLFAMQPDVVTSLIRLFQRVMGTLAAVPITLFTVEYAHSLWPLAAVVVLASAVVPYGIARNYWLACAAVVVFVISTLDIASLSQHGAVELLWIRLAQTALGCLLAGVGTLVAFPEFLPRILRIGKQDGPDERR